MENYTKIISDLGVPVATALGAGLGLGWMVKYLNNNLRNKLNEVVEDNQKSDAETKDIVIKLIDRIRALQTDVIRLDVLFRVKHKLPVDERRVQRSQKED